MAMPSSTSQLSCFSAIHRHLYFPKQRSLPFPQFPSKLSVVMSLEGHGRDGTTGSEAKNGLRYTSAAPKLHVEQKQESYPPLENSDAEAKQEHGVDLPKKTAKIHDFCLGIPFGGFVLSGGIIGFLLSRSTTALSNGVLYGGALLFLSTFSLKVWRTGKSSLPFILGQAALAGVLIWKNFQAYSLANKLFPAGFMAIICSAMLCFYLYVLLSGGNPPPKKLKTASMAS